MASKQKYCKRCQGYVLAHEEKRQQGCLEVFGHLFMCLLTGLIWLPIWILCSMCGSSKYLCSRCGEVCK